MLKMLFRLNGHFSVLGRIALISALWCMACPGAGAKVTMANCFSDRMVLQRGKPVAVFGKAEPGEKVTVSILDREVQTVADTKGNWKVMLEPLSVLPSGRSAVLTVSGRNTLRFNDVLIGDVWLGSGQSNMALPADAKDFVKEDTALAERVAAGPYPMIRLLRSDSEGWMKATPENLEDFSALLFSFGYRVQPEIGVPLGLMVGARGGTPTGQWVTPDMIRADERCMELIEKAKSPEHIAKLRAAHENRIEQWQADVESAKKKGSRVPGHPGDVVLPGDFEGAEVGKMFEEHLRAWVGYTFKGCVWDQGESGIRVEGINSQYDAMRVLINGWRALFDQPDLPFVYMQKPSGAGCAWNYDNPVTRFARPIVAITDDEFLHQRPHNHKGWVHIDHFDVMENNNAFMATTSDLGPGGHPVNKSGYGWRAGDVALNRVYARNDIPWIGPTYAGHSIEGDTVRITFDHVGAGLAVAHGDRLQGFIISDGTGGNRGFYWAEAVIAGSNTVLVSSPSVKNPKIVRYAYYPHYPWANLFSSNGLPALTFQIEGKAWRK